MLVRASSRDRSGERLGERRRLRRRRTLVALFILLLLLISAAVYGLNQSSVRIQDVDIYGLTSETQGELTSVVSPSLQGRYIGLIPRDSIFFYPEDEIRRAILASRQDIAAISIFRKGFNGLTIKINDRTPIARWCGLAPSGGEEEYCYVLDASGYIYDIARDQQTSNSFTLYAPLVGATEEPLRATIENAIQLPHTFDFARQLSTLGSPVAKVVIGDGEVRDYLESGTYITYMLGREQEAYTALISAHDEFSLTNGSVEYVDLRFDGRVYLKKKE